MHDILTDISSSQQVYMSCLYKGRVVNQQRKDECRQQISFQMTDTACDCTFQSLKYYVNWVKSHKE